MVVAGLAGIAVGAGIVAWRSMRWTLDGRSELGLPVAGLAALVAFPLALLLGGPLALTAPGAAIVLGFAAALARGGGGDDIVPDDEPPWWPSFEAELRRYESRVRS